MVDRAVPVDRELQHVRDRGREEVRGDDERKDDRTPQEQRRDHGEREPDDAEAADVRQRDEDRVERLRSMADDPPLEPLIELDHSRSTARKLQRQDLLGLVDQLLRIERLADERRRAALLCVRGATARRPGR